MPRVEFFQIRNWSEYQHYSNRNPPWIKVYNHLLSDYEFLCLPDHAKWHLVGLFLLASRTGNRLPRDPAYLRGQLGSSHDVDLDLLSPWIEPADCGDPGKSSKDNTLHTREQDASKPLVSVEESRERAEKSSVLSEPAKADVEKDGRRTDPNTFFDDAWELDGECWRWTRATDSRGYGLMWNSGYRTGAHRFSFEKFHQRPIEKDHEIHHRCGNKSCVNPEHLMEITRGEHNEIHRSTSEQDLKWNARLAPLAREVGGEQRVADWLKRAKPNPDEYERILIGLVSLRERGALAPTVKPGELVSPAVLSLKSEGQPIEKLAIAEYWRLGRMPKRNGTSQPERVRAREGV